MNVDDILAIPGNRPVFEDLQRLLTEKQAIAFVGAGASAGLYPLWEQLIQQLCEYAVANGFASDADRKFWLSLADKKPGQVVHSIRQKLTPPQLGSLLRSIFGPQPGSQRYTQTHAALMRVSFSGYVTTNYDPGLVEARLAERPAVTAVGWSTWRDSDDFDSWRSPTKLADPAWCPVLFAHGFYQRTDTIVLGIEEYRRAYNSGPWRRLFEHLWSSTHLVFTGFGFSDPFLDFITGEIVAESTGRYGERGRHIAFIGRGVEEPYSEEHRRFFLQNYNVRPIFYPAADRDHSALLMLLDILAARAESMLPAALVTSPLSTTFCSRWVHETTNDEQFKGREDQFARLDRWVADPIVRVIGITAVGGAGKTALVGHWLKNTTGWRQTPGWENTGGRRSRPFSGLFAWSFYQESKSTVFLRALLKWAQEVFGTTESAKEGNLVPAALRLLRVHSLVVVLDGLEVLQEGPEEARHGVFLDGILRELLGGLCAQQHDSLAILTSRFVFADLERHLGTTYHQLELPGLAPEQSAALLADLKVRGPEADRVYVGRSLEGHPLGLRVFSEAIPENQRDYPRDFLDETFRTGQLSLDSPLTGKVKRLLVFYQERLPIVQVRLLSVVALFRSPVAENTILLVVKRLFSDKPGPLPEDTGLIEELQKLHADGVLTREPLQDSHGFACHPILRDHFRTVLLTWAGTAQRAADLLKSQPSGERPQSVQEIESLLISIGLLLDIGDFRTADNLYRGRLANGKLFQWIPAIPEGLRCALGFVRDELRQRNCAEQLLPGRLSYYLNEVGLFASLSGQYELATRSYALAQETNHEIGRAVGLRNEASLLVYLGRLSKAVKRVDSALEHAIRLHDHAEAAKAHAVRGWARGLSGQMGTAAEDLAIARALEKKRSLESDGLSSARGIRRAEILVLGGQTGIAFRETKANIRISKRNNWNEDIARCHWMLGWCALRQARLAEAEAELHQAEPILRSGQMLFYLARLHVTAGLIALARSDAATALHRAGEALALAQPREMRLVHADALVLRGRARFLEAVPGRALDDADDALRLARDCRYAWAEHDALRLQADAHAALARIYEKAGGISATGRHWEAAHCARSEAEALSTRLRLTPLELEEAETKAATWLKQWEKKQRR